MLSRLCRSRTSADAARSPAPYRNHNIVNAPPRSAVGREAGTPVARTPGIAEPDTLRCACARALGEVVALVDCYNRPDSAAAAATLSTLGCVRRRIAVRGESSSSREQRRVARMSVGAGQGRSTWSSPGPAGEISRGAEAAASRPAFRQPRGVGGWSRTCVLRRDPVQGDRGRRVDTVSSRFGTHAWGPATNARRSGPIDAFRDDP